LFESNELVHFVFADDGDLYYRESLLQLDMNQYLWFGLKETGYNNIFFLNAADNFESFEMKTFDESSSEIFKPKWLSMYSTVTQFQRWMSGQLKDRAAIVCPLADFCRMFEKEEWQASIKELANTSKRTGILVLTAPRYLEDTRDFLLSSSVFEASSDGKCLCPAIDAMRKSKDCNMYAELKNSMGDRFVFLNTFTKDNIKNLLTHVLIEQNEIGRIRQGLGLDALTGYLNYYLNCPGMRQKEPLFDIDETSADLSFRALYKKINSGDVIRKLFARTAGVLSEGGIQEVLERRYGKMEQSEVQIFRKDELICRCMRLQLPSGIEKTKEQEKSQRTLYLVKNLLQSPRNCVENENVKNSLKTFLDMTREANDERDYGTYRRALDSVKFCVQWLYVEKGTEKEKEICRILGELEKNYIELSREYFSAVHSANIFARLYDKNDTSVAGRINRKKFEQYNSIQKILYDDLAICESGVVSSVENLRVTFSAEKIKETRQRLNVLMGEIEDNRQTILRMHVDNAMPDADAPDAVVPEKELPAEGSSGETVDKTLPDGDAYNKMVEKLCVLE
jgi:hypothetical protein